MIVISKIINETETYRRKCSIASNCSKKVQNVLNMHIMNMQIIDVI